ncbi:MAG: hypothetical protein MK078_10735 [Crocinitomicaceae bacterium]|nr:hypothetical protein [Crocinitomicaceae bacterium]
MKKIVLSGNLSNTSENLAKELAAHFSTFYVPSYLMERIETGDSLSKDDILDIALEQADRDNKGTSQYPDVLICFSDLITLKLYSEKEFGSCDEWISKNIDILEPDHYILLPNTSGDDLLGLETDNFLNEIKSKSFSHTTLSSSSDSWLNEVVNIVDKL